MLCLPVDYSLVLYVIHYTCNGDLTNTITYAYSSSMCMYVCVCSCVHVCVVVEDGLKVSGSLC